MFTRNACSSCHCRHTTSITIYRRLLATVVSSPPTQSQSSTIEPTYVQKEPKPRICAGIILNRAPLLTRTPTTFESLYNEYHSRIRRALQNPFLYDIYFKPGSLLETQFREEERIREQEAFGEGVDKEVFNQTRECQREQSEGGEEAGAESRHQNVNGENSVPMLQEHTDVREDVKSLDRKGDRNLYLLLQDSGKDIWRFPQGGVEKGELLHQAAQRELFVECGDRMDVWTVSRKPIGAFNIPRQTRQRELVFFIKAHILAGQVRADGKLLKDFAWLTKEEIHEKVDKWYWDGIKDMLSDH